MTKDEVAKDILLSLIAAEPKLFAAKVQHNVIKDWDVEKITLTFHALVKGLRYPSRGAQAS